MKITDDKLIEELQRRLDEKNRALFDLEALNRNLKMVNKKLKESEQLKSNFLSNLRNEINNPLATLTALTSELLSVGCKDNERYRSIAKMLHAEALNLDFQVRNIMAASELESGETAVYPTKVDINALVDDILDDFSWMLEDKKISVVKDGSVPMWLNTDSEKMRIAISNLISNAIIFNKEGGKVIISKGLQEGGFSFSVEDEGIGIKRSDLPLIFDRFRQVDMGARKAYRGHGLGLSVSKAVVELMGGEITVKSRPGKGSAFTVTIPEQQELEGEDMTVDGVELFDGAMEF